MNRYYYEALGSFSLSKKDFYTFVESIKDYVVGLQVDVVKRSKTKSVTQVVGRCQLICFPATGAIFLALLRILLSEGLCEISNFRTRSLPSEFDYSSFTKMREAQCLKLSYWVNKLEAMDKEESHDSKSD